MVSVFLPAERIKPNHLIIKHQKQLSAAILLRLTTYSNRPFVVAILSIRFGLEKLSKIVGYSSKQKHRRELLLLFSVAEHKRRRVPTKKTFGVNCCQEDKPQQPKIRVRDHFSVEESREIPSVQTLIGRLQRLSRKSVL